MGRGKGDQLSPIGFILFVLDLLSSRECSQPDPGRCQNPEIAAQAH